MGREGLKGVIRGSWDGLIGSLEGLGGSWVDHRWQLGGPRKASRRDSEVAERASMVGGRASAGKVWEAVRRASEAAGEALEAAGRASEAAWRAFEAAGRASEAATRASMAVGISSEAAGRPRGMVKESKIEETLPKIVGKKF